MKMSVLLGPVLLSFFLSSCNLYGGLSSPSNDEQYLIAARACFDRGDYQCALDNYKKLSSSYSDIQISENSLALLAQGNIFSISDLVRSLGTNLGSSASFGILAEALASRGVTTGASRSTTKTVYENNVAIQSQKLKAFSQFIASLAMFNEVLANAIGPDGKLIGADIAANPAQCRSSSGAAGCTAPVGTGLTYDVADATSFSSTPTVWAGPATIQKLITCAAEVVNQFVALGGASSNQGLIDSANQIKNLNVAGAEQVLRYSLLIILNLN